MCSLGYCYESGEGVEQDQPTAVAWYRRAAEGVPGGALVEAEGPLKVLDHALSIPLRGDGIAADESRAVECYRRAADMGYPPGS